MARKHLYTWKAKGANDRDYVVDAYRELHHAGTPDEPDAVLEGVVGHRTRCGRDVSYDEGRYTIMTMQGQVELHPDPPGSDRGESWLLAPNA